MITAGGDASRKGKGYRCTASKSCKLMELFGFTKARRRRAVAKRSGITPSSGTSPPLGEGPGKRRPSWMVLPARRIRIGATGAPCRVSERLSSLAITMRLGSGRSLEFPAGYPARFTWSNSPSGFPLVSTLGDPFPKNLFQERPEGGSHYDGPPVGDCLHPATWATSQRSKRRGKKKGRPSYRLRDAFADQWVWIAQLGMFGHRQGLVSMLDAATWNAKTGGFRTWRGWRIYFIEVRVDEVEGVDYLPGVPERLVQGPGQKLAYNLYVDSGVPAAPDICAEPWLEFVAYLVPNERERGEVLRWIATLLARPKIRMGYSLLMVSERQGVGKSLLGTILADCVGRNNASSPGISDIMSDFNAWSAQSPIGRCS